MARILVTGSRGVVGAKLVELLAERGHSVFGADIHHADGEIGWSQVMAAGERRYARCDVASYRDLLRIVEAAGPFDVVYHAAAEFGRWNGEDYYEKVWTTNAIGTKHVIRLQEQFGFRLVFFSTSEVYGDYDDVMAERVLDEVPIRQMNDYALSKWVNEQQIHNSAQAFGTESVIVRLFNTYGPGEWYHPYRSVNAKFCFHAINGMPMTVFRDHYRTSTYLDDACHALANIVDNFRPGEIYNIGSTEYHSIEELARLVIDAAGADPALVTYAPSEKQTTRIKKVDIAKAVRDLDLRMTVDLATGVRRTVDWMKAAYRRP